MTDQIKCAANDCETIIDLYEDDSWSTEFNGGATYCYPCGEADMQNCSTLWRFTPDGTERVYFGDLVAQDEYGEIPSWFANLIPTGWSGRSWHRTDGWRGHFESVKSFIGICELENGWATTWLDESISYKAHFNNWVEGMIVGLEVVPAPVFVLFEPTSNVFSTGTDVFCMRADEEIIKNYLAERLGDDGLRLSLG
jgi:hypothetical protein